MAYIYEKAREHRLASALS